MTAATVIVPDASVCAPRDRAGVVATSILLIVATAQRGWMAGDEISVADVRAEIAALLRDEFSDTQYTTLCEIRLEDDSAPAAVAGNHLAKGLNCNEAR